MTRVLQLGNYGDDGGGISSVLREFSTWEWPTTTQAYVDTYATDPRFWGAKRFIIAAAQLIRNRRDADIVHVHLSERGSFLREGSLVLLASALRMKVVVTLHGADFTAFAGDHPAIVRRVLARADAIAALTDSTIDAVRQLDLPAPTLIPNAVSEPADDETSTPFEDRRSIVYAGVVATRKGADVLFEAWPNVVKVAPEARLIVFGQRIDVDVPADDTIVAMGKRPRSEVREAVREARTFVLPSRAEAFPMAILEAMSAGVPVIATDVGQVRNMLDDGDLTIPAGDVTALARTLAELASDPVACARAGAANLARYRAHFSPDVVAGQYEEIYAAVMDGHSAVRPNERR